MYLVDALDEIVEEARVDSLCKRVPHIGRLSAVSENGDTATVCLRGWQRLRTDLLDGESDDCCFCLAAPSRLHDARGKLLAQQAAVHAHEVGRERQKLLIVDLHTMHEGEHTHARVWL